MNLNDIHRGITKHRKPKRLGRGKGTGQGKTAGRGHKGQKARAGWSAPPTFEGGQMPLARRVPKRGFHNAWAANVAIVNLGDIDAVFDAGAEVTPESLRAKKLVKGQFDALKVLGDGALTKAVKVSAHRFSKSAVEKIQQAGGEAIVLPGKKPVVKNKQRSARSSDS
ncbi:MAG: 50S ribosomal protein L15 [Thermoguttaceae bacterium]|jgi:large subunit ribosomal protein L15|nr:50S ribosomal protein L15 [Thermoguttaceae bacterium]